MVSFSLTSLPNVADLFDLGGICEYNLKRMNDFLFTANAVLPIVILIAIGYILKRTGLFSTEFLNVGNKLTYRIFLPALLFCNVYKISDFTSINWYFVLYGVAGVIVVALLATGLYCLFTKDNGRRGVLIQSAFRSNYAIIGIPLATALFGQEGAATASVMSVFAIPLFNILAVICLSVFNKNENNTRLNVGRVLLGIVKNPLIIGVAAGFAVLGVRALLQACDVSFRLTDVGFVYSAIQSLGAVATPLALIILGGQFTFTSAKAQWRPIVLATVVRTVIVPAVTLLLAGLIVPNISGDQYATYVAVFATPVAVSSAVLAKEMNGDDVLAGQLVVWTSVASSVTLFVIIFVMRCLRVF